MSRSTKPEHDILTEEPELVARIRRCMPDSDFRRVSLAYQLMWQFHGHQLRHSGDCYVTHTSGVTRIAVFELGLTEARTVIAAMLHDVVEDTHDEYITKSEPEVARYQLYEEWGYPIAYWILLLSKAKWQTIEGYFADIKYRGDWRVRALKLADRLHNLRTLYACPPEKQVRKAKETMEHVVPMIDDLVEEIPRFEHEMPEDFAGKVAKARAEVIEICARYLEI